MQIIKGSNHSKITGDFGEALVLYWLSKSGFECARVDHTGIDLIAATGDLKMGISVKSRCRVPGTEGESVKLLPADLKKARAACADWGLEAYFAFVVDATDTDTIRAFLIPADHLKKSYSRKGKVGYWRMSERDLVKYSGDRQVKSFCLRAGDCQWW